MLDPEVISALALIVSLASLRLAVRSRFESRSVALEQRRQAALAKLTQANLAMANLEHIHALRALQARDSETAASFQGFENRLRKMRIELSNILESIERLPMKLSLKNAVWLEQLNGNADSIQKSTEDFLAEERNARSSENSR